MNTRLFSVIILHYCQPQYLKGAIDSVLMQNYPSVELILADDGSDNLNRQEITEYIQIHKRSNIKNVICRFNDNNIGTIKNINEAVKASSGEYVLFFAADDVLYSDNVLTCFAEELNKDVQSNLVCAQSVMMSHDMGEELGNFVPELIIKSGNQMTAREQHTALLYQCCYAAGATAFRRKCFNHFGLFDESYKVIEDWTYFLEYTNRGGYIPFCNFNALKHRAGGISENGKSRRLSDIYYNDIKKIYLEKVLPYVDDEKDIDRKSKILLHYKDIERNSLRICLSLFKNMDVVIYLIKRVFKKFIRKK